VSRTSDIKEGLRLIVWKDKNTTDPRRRVEGPETTKGISLKEKK
jgi:hypothetical protein